MELVQGQTLEIERGSNWERVFLPDGSRTVRVYPSLKYFQVNGEWVTHSFEVNEGFIQASSPYIGVRVYPYYAEIWTPDFNEVRCYNERWVLEILQAKRYKDAGGWNPTLSVVEDDEGVRITRSMTCFDGSWNVTYWVRASGSLLTTFTFELDNLHDVRVRREMSGIVGDQVAYNDLDDFILKDASISGSLEVNPSSLIFKGDSNDFLMAVSLWNNIDFTLNETSGEILEVKSNVDSCTLDYHSFGHSKMDLILVKDGWNLTSSGFVVDPTTVHASEDAYVWSGYPDLNYGSDNYLEIRNWSGTRWSYLKFDVSAITSVTDADLILYVQGFNEYGTTTIALNNVTDDSWTEAGITWNNKKAVGEEFEVKSIGGAVNSTHTWSSNSLTAFVSHEVDNDNVVSLAITFKAGFGRQRYWSTEENGKDPYLEITEGAPLQEVFDSEASADHSGALILQWNATEIHLGNGEHSGQILHQWNATVDLSGVADHSGLVDFLQGKIVIIHSVAWMVLAVIAICFLAILILCIR